MGGAVPLSEHEQRQLEQIEQALYSEYPKLAQSADSLRATWGESRGLQIQITIIVFVIEIQ